LRVLSTKIDEAALGTPMNIESVLEELAGWGEDDWLGLWLIVAYVADDLGIEDDEKQLELTVILVRELLKRGLQAGDSPVQNSGPKFVPWRDQDEDAIAAFIEHQWRRNDEFPSWGDAPWFAAPRFCRFDA
jgi:hypothetical protein